MCGKYCSSIVKTEYMRSRISKVKVKRDCAFQNSFNTQHINSSSLMPTFYSQYNYQWYNCERKYWYMSLCFLPVSYWIELHCVTANQSRAQHWAAQWNSQSEQSSTLLFMTLPHKPITDRFILGRNPRVLNGHVKPFLENLWPYLSHIPSM